MTHNVLPPMDINVTRWEITHNNSPPQPHNAVHTTGLDEQAITNEA